MGEARRRRLVSAQNPCICGSGRLASKCCFLSGAFHKTPAHVDLRRQTDGFGLGGCYLRDLSTCSEKLSREHLVSEGVLNTIAEGDAVVSGFPWQEAGKQKAIGKSNLVARCLCETHNNSLSPLDTAATNLFLALKRCHDEQRGPPIHFLVSGHDLERWMLKTLAAFASSRNLARAGVRLDGRFDAGIYVAELLLQPERWIRPMGLYFTLRQGEHYQRKSVFAFAPLASTYTDRVAGMTLDVNGMEFALLLSGDQNIPAVMHNTCYHPTNIRFRHRDVTHRIQICWIDRKHRGDIVVSTNVMPPSAPPPPFGKRGPFILS